MCYHFEWSWGRTVLSEGSDVGTGAELGNLLEGMQMTMGEGWPLANVHV